MPRKNPQQSVIGEPAQRRRMAVADRERQILDGAIAFFARQGFDGQLRDLARSVGVTHALLYHYFPTKQALVDRVYAEVFEACWKPEWERWLDDPQSSSEDKLTRFYVDYAATVLQHNFVRILVFSGLSDQSITNRFFGLLRERLFPRIIRETRRMRRCTRRHQPSLLERELMMGLHGSIFYAGMRRWVYGQAVYSEGTPHDSPEVIRCLVRSYLQASMNLVDPPARGSLRSASVASPAGPVATFSYPHQKD
jgi:AcrR family transcriptional regulator